ncbi:MAG TPA: hypothetical protein VGN00_22040 [Puia sp.]|jgi:hypothetical protein
MLSKEENDFIGYWEKNRLRQKKVVRQFLVGIPVGLLIVVPTVISFTSGWYKRAEMEANSADFNPMVLFVALLLIVAFTAIFYQRWRWEQYDQRYQELVARRDRKASATSAATPAPAKESEQAAKADDIPTKETEKPANGNDKPAKADHKSAKHDEKDAETDA